MEIPEILAAGPGCEIITTRVFHASQELVYKAWTDPVHLKNWWGPAGFTNTFHRHELWPGGRWSFIMHGPDKGNYVNECTFILVETPRRLIWNHDSPPWFQVEAEFEVVSSKETRVIFRMKFKTAEECRKLKNFVPEKNEENMDRLKTELTKMKPA